jgi:hypothetical protein
MTETSVEPRRVGTLTLAITAAFGLFFALAVWAAVGNAIRFARAWAEIEQSAPWWLFVVGILVPIGLYVLAFVLGRYRRPLELAVLLLTALAVSSALGLALTSLASLLFTDLVLSLR